MEIRLHPMEFSHYRLPFVCAVSGEPAAWYARIDVKRSMHPAALLLIFLGPIGWLVLLALALRLDGTYVELPISEAVYEEIHERRRRLRWMVLVLVVATVAFFYLANQLLAAALLIFVPVVGMAVWAGRVKGHSRLRLSVDAVGLVTIRRVHPEFAAAVESWRSDLSRRTPA